MGSSGGSSSRLTYKKIAAQLAKCLLQVVDEILRVFQANRDTDGPGLDAGPAQFFLGHVVVRTVDREDHQRFDATQARCE